MTEENLQKGNNLLRAINKVNEELEVWEKATSYNTTDIFLNVGIHCNKVIVERVIDFDEMKRMAVGRLKHKLQILKDEFSKL